MYAYPALGKLPVAAIDKALVLKAIEPIWYSKTETASRVRGRIKSVLDFAKTRGYRSGKILPHGRVIWFMPCPRAVPSLKLITTQHCPLWICPTSWLNSPLAKAAPLAP